MSVRMQQTEKRLEMLDRRLDSLDSMVTGNIIQIMVTSNVRSTSKG